MTVQLTSQIMFYIMLTLTTNNLKEKKNRTGPNSQNRILYPKCEGRIIKKGPVLCLYKAKIMNWYLC